MERFKQIIIKIFQVVLFLAFAAGCVKGELPKEVPGVCDSPQENTGLFDVLEVEGSVDIVDTGATNSVLDSEFVLEFNACMTDALKLGGVKVTESDFTIYTFQPYDEIKSFDPKIQNRRVEPYRIPTDEVERDFISVQAKTDSNGCLRWSEKYKFEYPAEKKWIYFERVIKNLSGQAIIRLMVNPWLQEGAAAESKIIDLRYNEWAAGSPYHPFKMDEQTSESETNKGAEQCLRKRSLSHIFDYLEKESSNNPALWTDDIQLKSLYENIPMPEDSSSDYYEKYSICYKGQTSKKCDQVGSFLRIGIDLPMKILSKNYLNQVEETPIDRGTFLVTPYLVAKDEDSYVMLHRPIEPIEAEINSSNEPLKVPEFLVHIPFESSSAPVKMVLKVEAKEQKQPQPFYGIFTVSGEIDNLHHEGRNIRLDPSETDERTEIPLESLKAEEKDQTDSKNKKQAVQTDSESVVSQEETQGRFEQQIQRINLFKTIFKRLNGKRSYLEFQARGREGFSRSKLALDLKRMRFIRVDAAGKCESVVDRTALYLGEVCLRDPRRNINFNNQTLTVLAEDLKFDFSDSELDIQKGQQYKIETFDPQYVIVTKDQLRGERYFCNGNPIHPSVFETLPLDAETGLRQCPKNTTLVDGYSTDHLGCIQFMYRLNHKLYDRQQFFPKKLIFKSAKYGYEDEKIVMFNPWEFGFLTYQDITQPVERVLSVQEEIKRSDLDRTEKVVSVVRANSKNTYSFDQSKKLKERLFDVGKDLKSLMSSENLTPPSLRLNEFRSMDIEPSYRIDRSLDISTVKNIMFILQPKIFRPDPMATSIRSEPMVLPKGYWLMRFILAKGPQEMEEGGKDRITIAEMEKDVRTTLDPIAQFHAFYKHNQLINQLQKQQWREGHLDKNHNALNFFEAENDDWENSKCMSQNCFNFTKEDYISHYDTLAYSENGVLSTFVKLGFDMNQFRYMGSKNSIIFEIYPTDPTHYKYKIKDGKRTCEIDIENSKFFPYTNHELKNPPHWGLFHSSEFGNFNIVRPIGKINIETFDQLLGPVGHSFPHTSMDPQVLKHNVQVLNQFGKDVGVKDSKNFYKFSVEEVYDDIHSQGYANYCTDLLSSSQLIEGKIDASVDGLWFKMCVCNPSDETDFKHEKVRKCLYKSDFVDTFESVVENSEKRSQLNKDFMYLVEDIVHNNDTQLDKKLFCTQAFSSKKLSSKNYEGDSDLSVHGTSYRECVCNDRTDDSLTQVLARCFSENEGLVFVNTQQASFLEDLNKGVKTHRELSNVLHREPDNNFYYMPIEETIDDKKVYFTDKLNDLPSLNIIDQEGLEQIIEDGFSRDNVNNNLQGSFLHLMCHFWFNQYYENYLVQEDVDNFYKVKTSDLQKLKRLAAIYPDLKGEDSILRNVLSEEYVLPEKYSYTSKPFPFSLSQIKNYGPGHPYRNCLKNPLYFFHIEKKTLVGNLSQEDLKYKNGNVNIFNVGDSVYKESRKDWGERQSFSLEGAVDVSAKISIKVLDVGGKTTGRTASSREESTGNAKRKAKTTSKAITMAVNDISVELPLNQYKQCLLIRPKGLVFGTAPIFKKYDDIWGPPLNESVFENKESLEFHRWPYRLSGLLLCNREKNSETDSPLSVQENYYYVHQFFGGHAYEFMSRTIYHNRPYTSIIRGKEELDKFMFFVDAQFKYDEIYDQHHTDNTTPENLFRYKNRDIKDPVIRAFLDTPMDASSFYPGIYSHRLDLDSYYLTNLEILSEPSPADADDIPIFWDRIANFAMDWFKDLPFRDPNFDRPDPVSGD